MAGDGINHYYWLNLVDLRLEALLIHIERWCTRFTRGCQGFERCTFVTNIELFQASLYHDQVIQSIFVVGLIIVAQRSPSSTNRQHFLVSVRTVLEATATAATATFDDSLLRCKWHRVSWKVRRTRHLFDSFETMSIRSRRYPRVWIIQWYVSIKASLYRYQVNSSFSRWCIFCWKARICINSLCRSDVVASAAFMFQQFVCFPRAIVKIEKEAEWRLSLVFQDYLNRNRAIKRFFESIRNSLLEALQFSFGLDKRLSFSLTNTIPCQDYLDHCPVI
jgi:hypothetical protein